MTVFDVAEALSKAQEVGKELAAPTTWANRASLSAKVVVALNVVVLTLGAFGVHITISTADIATIAQAFSVVAFLVIDYIHVAANPHAGKSK